MDPVDLRSDVYEGSAYEKEFPINWCPSCKTGLANEEVVNGCRERCVKLCYKEEPAPVDVKDHCICRDC